MEADLRDQGTLSHAVFNLSLDAIVTMDDAGVITSWNPAAKDLFGWTRQQAVGKLAADLIVPPVYREAHEEGLRRFRETGKGPVLGQVLDHLQARHRDGRHFPVELRISEAGREGGHAVFAAFIRDISAEKRMAALQEAKHAITRVIAGAPDWEVAIPELLQMLSSSLSFAVAEAWIVNPETNKLEWGSSWYLPDVDLTSLQKASRQQTFSRGRGLLGRVWSSARPVAVTDAREHPGLTRFRHALKYGLRSALAFPVTSDGQVVAVIVMLGKLDAMDQPLLDALIDIGSQIGEFLSRKRAETALRQAQARIRTSLEYQAFHDALTGLPNRGLFDDRLEEAIRVAERERRNLGLLLLDLDDFKMINDQFGHVAGDAVLREAAVRLRRALRNADTVARLGGDEFAVIPHGEVNQKGLEAVAKKIARAFSRRFRVENLSIPVGASVGGALYPQDGADPSVLLRKSDAAMYQAKRRRSGFVMYESGMGEGRGGSVPVGEGSITPTDMRETVETAKAAKAPKPRVSRRR